MLLAYEGLHMSWARVWGSTAYQHLNFFIYVCMYVQTNKQTNKYIKTALPIKP